MPKIDREELACAAGFFNGEGCFFNGMKGSPALTIGQIERQPLEQFDAAVGHLGRIVVSEKESNGDKKMHRYHIHGFEKCQAVAVMLWKWLSPRRREQALAMLRIGRVLGIPARLRTHCPQGHPLDGIFELGNRGGKYVGTRRYCKTCNRENQVRRRQVVMAGGGGGR